FDRARAKRHLHPDRRAGFPFRMLGDAVADLPREIQPLTVALEHVHDSQALLVVAESAWHEAVDDALAGVPEWRVAKIVSERDRLGELLVQPEDLRNRTRDL